MGWSRYFRRKQWDDERSQKVAAYLDMETAENEARGMPPMEARNAARRKLGNTTLIREEIYRMNTIGFLETLWQDIVYSTRLLRKTPAFTAIGVLSLALGIGANTAIFSVVHAVLLRPLPYPAPAQLLRVGPPGNLAANMPQLEFWKQHSTTFLAAAGSQGYTDQTMQYGGRAAGVQALRISRDYFRTLGVPLALGREFDASEIREGGPQAIILSNALWRDLFGGDPTVVGRVVRMQNVSFTVVGVAPAGLWVEEQVNAFIPLRSVSGTVGDYGMNTEMLARLKPGVSLRQAQAENAALNIDYKRVATKLEDFQGLTLMPYHDFLVGDVRTKILLLFGAVVLLLLIACSNLASLMLARLAARQKEIAMRLALGGGRGRLLRQFLTENLMLGAAGCALGIAGGRWALDALLAVIPFKLPAAGPIRMDLPVLAFTLSLGLGTSLLFALAPFFGSARINVYETLKSAGRTLGAGRQGARGSLVVAEVALSVTLLVSAALLIQSLYRLYHERLGFDPRGLITFFTPAAGERRSDVARLRTFEATLRERLEALPGVRGVAAVSSLPLTSQSNYPTEHEGHPGHDIGGMEIRHVTYGYFEVMGTPVIRGRTFTKGDVAGTTPVILVNETVARRWWPEGNPIGDRVVVGRFKGKDLDVADIPREVVGVVADTKTMSLKAPPRPTVYLCIAQVPWYDSGMNWVVRGSFAPGFTNRLRQVIAESDPRQRIDRVRTMDEIVTNTTGDFRFDAWLFGGFAALALVLTAIGVYGLLAFSVERRTSEFGTRLALGASRGNVLQLVLRQGLGLIALGLAAGLASAFALTRSLSTLLFGVRPGDPFSFAAVAVLLLAVGALASYIPARRATRVDPMVALRYE